MDRKSPEKKVAPEQTDTAISVKKTGKWGGGFCVVGFPR
jgi:hypothetical protein